MSVTLFRLDISRDKELCMSVTLKFVPRLEQCTQVIRFLCGYSVYFRDSVQYVFSGQCIL